jgi:hypothetical protein
MTNTNPYGGNLLHRVDVFSMSPFLFLRKEQSHYDSSKYNCWLHGPASMDEKGNSCMFSPFTNKIQYAAVIRTAAVIPGLCYVRLGSYRFRP